MRKYMLKYGMQSFVIRLKDVAAAAAAAELLFLSHCMYVQVRIAEEGKRSKDVGF